MSLANTATTARPLSLLFSLHAEVADPRFFFRVYSWRSEVSCKNVRSHCRHQDVDAVVFFLSFSIGISDWRWDGGIAKTTQRGATSARNKKKKKKKKTRGTMCLLTICGEMVPNMWFLLLFTGRVRNTFLQVFFFSVLCCVLALSQSPHRISIEPVFFFHRPSCVTDHLMRRIDICRVFFKFYLCYDGTFEFFYFFSFRDLFS